jgi:hypothetical protein
MVQNSPGSIAIISPPHKQDNIDISSMTGKPPIKTVGALVIHGSNVIGMHGASVTEPKEAIIAAITIGFSGLLHKPNGMIFKNGILHIISAKSNPSAITMLMGKTIRGDGINPIVQSNKANSAKQKPIFNFSFLYKTLYI